MRPHTQLKIFSAGVLIALVTLTNVTAPAQVMRGGQYKGSAVVVSPQDTRESAHALRPALPGLDRAERIGAIRMHITRPEARFFTLDNSLSFLPAVAYDSGGQGAISAAVADVNGDGKPDLVVLNSCPTSGCSNSEPTGVLLGNGDGTFQTAVTYGSGGVTAYAIGSVAIADVNGDGKADLVVTNVCGADSNCTGGSLGVLLGNGNGTFRTAVTYSSGGYFDRSVAVADINGDGKLDLLLSNNCTDVSCGSDGVVGVLLGNGDGTFQTAVTYGSGGIVAEWVAVADVNGDSKPDLLMANGDGSVGVLLGKGDGTFGPAVAYQSGGYHKSLAVADVNGDGRPDVVVPSYATNTVEVLLGNGDGTFQAGVSYGSGGIDARSVAVADVSGDGIPDLLIANECADFNCFSGTVGVLLGNGDGTFKTAIAYGSGGYFAQSLAVADLNGDGRPDLLVADFSVDSYYSDSGVVAALLNNTVFGRSTTSTSFISSLNPSIYGQKVTWTATVTTSGSIPPTGKVKFTWARFTIGSATLNSGGVATLTKANLDADQYPLTAVYVGDAANLGSASTVLNQVVLEATSAAKLTSSPNPSTQGHAVTFTAKISSPTVTPTGPVTFTAGKTLLGTAQLSGGKATLTISSLALGSIKVIVSYYGDSNIAKSSASVVQTVQ